MSKYEYNPWPLGKLPEEFQRPEPKLLLDKGYRWVDAREIVDIFENKVAEYFGSKYAVAIDCCSHSIFLCLRYLRTINQLQYGDLITIPNHTYVSVPMQINHAGLRVDFWDIKWDGCYPIFPTNVIDAAVMWEKNSYVQGSLMCLSFQLKKAVPIGKGGMILTDDINAYNWLRLARYDGRDLITPYDSEGHVKMIGWHYYMTPEDAARGILLMDQVGDKGKYMGSGDYPDVSLMTDNIK
jgi:dTDP-4-amino-4,6-dideoxygalactose transaminase